MRSLSLFFAITMLCGAAHAQIYKCKDDKGQLLLSDKPCASGQLLLEKRSAEQNYQDDVRAYEAQLNKQDRRAREAQKEYAKQVEAMRYQRHAPPPVASEHKGYDERLAERNAGVKSILDKPQKRIQNMDSIPAPLPEPARYNNGAPVHMQSCSGPTCQDASGQQFQYNKASPNTMIGPNGAMCTRNGTSNGGGWLCN